MATRFYKHKLLLDENMPRRTYFPSLNARFDVKHIALDYKQRGLPGEAVNEENISKHEVAAVEYSGV